MGFLNLAVLVLQYIGFGPVQNPHSALSQRGGMLAGGNPFTGRFNSDHGDRIIDKGVEQTHGIAAAANASDEHIRQAVTTLGSREGGLMMVQGLSPDVPLENARALMDAMERYAGLYS